MVPWKFVKMPGFTSWGFVLLFGLLYCVFLTLGLGSYHAFPDPLGFLLLVCQSIFPCVFLVFTMEVPNLSCCANACSLCVLFDLALVLFVVWKSLRKLASFRLDLLLNRPHQPLRVKNAYLNHSPNCYKRKRLLSPPNRGFEGLDFLTLSFPPEQRHFYTSNPFPRTHFFGITGFNLPLCLIFVRRSWCSLSRE